MIAALVLVFLAVAAYLYHEHALYRAQCRQLEAEIALLKRLTIVAHDK